MPSVENLIRQQYGPAIAMTDMNEINRKIRRIATQDGLGVAILVAWQHGLEIGHIPLQRDEYGAEEAEQAQVLAASDRCPYVFAHVPIRQIRGDKNKLAAREIMNQDADPALFIYHEDGLIGTFSFRDPGAVKLTVEDLREILDTLAQQGILMPANIDNRQIQFKDLAAKRRIEESRENVYVRVENRPLEKGRLPIELNWEEVWDYVVATLRKKSACNYCSVQALTPHEVTIHSAHVFSPAGQWDAGLPTVRNYQLGFTFAPFGDPRQVCHFLAWDFPHINDLVMNMEAQAYSFSDLIRLVRQINQDIRRYCAGRANPLPEPISGICNHWAGNSIYHQHYQFVNIPELPLVRAFKDSQLIARYRNTVEVRKCAGWPSPTFLITSLEVGRDEEVMHVADRVAREWRLLNEGEDLSYGNGIAIRNHTQNLFVTAADGQVSAIFIPRDRRKISTSGGLNSIEGRIIQKENAGVLEMMGYFLIDDPDDFAALANASPEDRKTIGNLWLSKLEPDKDAIREFEASVGICLNEQVALHEKRIDETIADMADDWRRDMLAVASSIQRDKSLNDQQRGHLYRELLAATAESRAGYPARREGE